MMAASGLSADLFEQNVDNYHNTPVTLFEQPGNEDAAKMVVCYDCHGSHTIQESDNTVSTVNTANLLETCQKCHPDATTSFVNTGPAHAGTSGIRATAVNLVSSIYAFSMVVFFGCMSGYLLLDRRKRHKEKDQDRTAHQAEE